MPNHSSYFLLLYHIAVFFSILKGKDFSATRRFPLFPDGMQKDIIAIYVKSTKKIQKLFTNVAEMC